MATYSTHNLHITYLSVFTIFLSIINYIQYSIIMLANTHKMNAPLSGVNATYVALFLVDMVLLNIIFLPTTTHGKGVMIIFPSYKKI